MSKIWSFGDFVVNAKTAELLREGVPVKIQRKPFEVLLALLETPGQVVSREALYLRLWPGVAVDCRRGLDTAVKKLRRAVDDPDKTSTYIETSTKRGYRLTARVSDIADQQVSLRNGAGPTYSESYARLPVHTRLNSEASRLYVQGYHCCNKQTAASVNMALFYFERAHDLEPSNGVHLAAIAHAYLMIAAQGMVRPVSVIAQAKAAALEALGLDNSQVMPHLILAWARGLFDYDLKGSLTDLEGIVADSPENPWCYIPYAIVLAALGLHQRSREAMEKGHLLDPVSPTISSLRAFLAYLAGDHSEAEELGVEAVSRDPDFGLGQLYFGQILLENGKYSQSIHHLEIANNILEGSVEARALLGLGYAAMGNRQEAKSIDDELEKTSSSGYADAYHRALLKRELGAQEEAVNLIERAYDDHSQWLAVGAVDPKLASLRHDPQVRKLLRRVKR